MISSDPAITIRCFDPGREVGSWKPWPSKAHKMPLRTFAESLGGFFNPRWGKIDIYIYIHIFQIQSVQRNPERRKKRGCQRSKLKVVSDAYSQDSGLAGAEPATSLRSGGRAAIGAIAPAPREKSCFRGGCFFPSAQTGTTRAPRFAL